MRLGMFCLGSLLVVCSACASVRSGKAGSPPDTSSSPAVAAASSAGDSGAAEYAVRWLLPRQNLDDAQQVINALHGVRKSAAPSKPAKKRNVVYYTVSQPGPLPDDYKATLRRRSDSKNSADVYEYTYKVRGPAPRPATLTTPTACAAMSARVEEESDFTVRAGTGQTHENISLSCSIETSSPEIPERLRDIAAEKRPCKISMARSKVEWAADAASPKRAAIKIEAWSFSSSKGETRALLEVSWKGSASPEDAEAFRERVEPLLTGAGESVPVSKEEMAEQCDADFGRR